MLLIDIIGPLPNSFIVEDFALKMEDDPYYTYPEFYCRDPEAFPRQPKFRRIKVTAEYFLPYCGFTRENLSNIRAEVTMIDGRDTHYWDGKFPITERVGYQVKDHEVSAYVELRGSTLCFDSYDMTIETQRINLADPGPALERLRARLHHIAKNNRMVICSNKTHLLFLKA